MSGGVAGGRPRRLAYADPPYPGRARLYRDHPDYDGEVDHRALLARLAGYDAWALSTSARALPAVLGMCPPGVRVAAWHRGERPHQHARYPLNAWEPVLYVPAPAPAPAGAGGGGRRRVDSLVHGVAPMTTLPGRVIGAKPAVFCAWLFGLLGARPGDHLDDLFPGSGAVTRAWAAFTRPAGPTRGPTSGGVAQVLRDGYAPAPDDAPPTALPTAAPGAPSEVSRPAGHDTSRPPSDATPADTTRSIRSTRLERT